MAIKFPDILENQNPSFALVDSFQFRGNSYPINNIEDTGSIPEDKRKEGAIIFTTGSGDFYGFKGTGSGEWNEPTNWVKLITDSNNTYPFPYTGSAQITGSLGVTGSINATNFTGSSFTGSFVGDGSGLTNVNSENQVYKTGSNNNTIIPSKFGTFDNTGTNSAIASGNNNKITSNCSFIGGGTLNTASADCTFVGGGYQNSLLTSTISAYDSGGNLISVTVGTGSVIVGGTLNTSSADNSFIGGGCNNKIPNGYREGSVIVGGTNNSTISGYAGPSWKNTFIGGGSNNKIESFGGAFLGGGYSNTISGIYNNTIVGGSTNSLSGGCNFIGGGSTNTLSGGYNNVLAGGSNNTISAYNNNSILGGSGNQISAYNYSSIVGGQNNTVSGYNFNNFIGGGRLNKIGGTNSNYSSIVGGFKNTSSATRTFIGGGSCNQATAVNSSIVGGEQNTASAARSFIGGGLSNQVSGINSSVVGGTLNTSSADNSFIGGGRNNTTSGGYNAIVGGVDNSVSNAYSFIGGGRLNKINSNCSFIGGGFKNTSSAARSFIGGGSSNQITSAGTNSSIVGGSKNTSSAAYADILGGQNNHACNINSFIVGSDLTTNKSCYTFMNNLDVAGTISASIFSGSFVGNGSGLTNLPISDPFPFTGSAQITGSLGLTGSITTDILEFNNNDGDLATQFFYDPIDVGTFIQTNITFDLTQDSQPQGIFFKPDGLKMYMVGRGGDDLYEYDLTTAWDITTLTFLQQIPVISELNPYDVFFSPDGFYFYIVGASRDSVRQYNVSTAWDISTVTSNFELQPLPYSTGNLPNPVNVNFKPDGTLMFVGDNNVELIVTYELSTPWDISTASFLSQFSTVNIPSTGTTIPTISITTMFGLRFSDDGTSIFITDSTKDTIYQLDLSTAWDPTTSTFNSKTYRSTVITDENVITGIFVAESQKKTFVSSTDSDFIRQINMGGLIISSSNGEESTSIALKGGLNVSQDIISNQYLIANNLSVDSNSYLYGSLITYNTTTLCQAASGTVTLLAGTVYNGPSRVDIQSKIFWGLNGVTQSNQYSARAHNLNLIRPIAGPRVRLNIGVYATGSNDNKPHSGIIDIKSLAQTFSHSGSLDIGRTLKVEGKADYELYNLSSATQIFLDNFIETGASAVNLDAHTPDVGIGWTKSLTNPGGNTRTLQVQPNSDGIVQISSTVASQGLIYTCETLPTSVNYELTATFRRQDNSDDTFHLIVKYVDNDNFYFLTWSASAANCQLRKIEGGVVTRVTDVSQIISSPFNYGVFNTTSDNLSPEMLLKLRFINNRLMVWNGTTSDFVFRGSFQVDSDFNDGDGGVFRKFGIGIGAIYAGSIDDQTTNWKLSSFQVNNLGPISVLDDTTVNYINSGSFGIGTTSPNASSVLDITSTTKGILLPRMTTTEINAISPLTEGLTAYNTTLNTMCFYNGTEWRQVSNTTM